MLPYSGERSFRFKAIDWLARTGESASVLRNMSLKNGSRYVLLDPLLQPLRSTTHVPTIKSGTEINKQCCFDVKRAVHYFGLQAEVV